MAGSGDGKIKAGFKNKSHTSESYIDHSSSIPFQLSIGASHSPKPLSPPCIVTTTWEIIHEHKDKWRPKKAEKICWIGAHSSNVLSFPKESTWGLYT